MTAMPSSSSPTEARQRLEQVQARIAAACARAGRDPRSVVLIGVGKTQPPSVIQEFVDLGLRDIGENRVAEFIAKQARIRGVHWHFIGRLQRRKARDVVGRRALVHSVDRHSLADELSRRAEAAGEVQRVLVQVNVADDPAKGGCRADDVLDLVAYARGLPHLSVEGLMTIPPMPAEGEDPASAARPYFVRLRELRDQARELWPEVAHLSMGMSADLEAAVEEGATMVRVGTALFGPRLEGPWQPGGENR